MLSMRYFIAAAGCAALIFFSSGLSAAPENIKKTEQANVKASAPEKSEDKPESKADLSIGQQINGVCAGCHGPLGEGGKKGEYPRIAGQNFQYLKTQLIKFKARHRVNIPMFPYTEEREMPDEDIDHIAAYLAGIKLDTTLPVFKESDDALTRLTAMSKVFNIPRAEGDADAGMKIYKRECASCHGPNAMGKKGNPMLAGQYTEYLKRQNAKFQSGERVHDESVKNREEEILNLLKPEELRDVLAYLSTITE